MKKQLNIKKLILLNLPYILMGLFSTNFGEAWRMAVGADASAKMLSFFSTLPVALASWWPSLHPLDLLVGLCCGGGLRLAVYLKHQNEMVFPIGAPNDDFAKYFIGQSYLAPLSTQQVGIYNVTFEPGCRNNWHIHHAKNGGGQILVCVAGRGYYQEWGKPAQELRPGDVVNIPTGVKHWHGAAPDSWFSHLAVEVPGDETSNEWLEAVDNTVYFKATGKEV